MMHYYIVHHDYCYADFYLFSYNRIRYMYIEIGDDI